MQHWLVVSYLCFGTTYRSHLQGSRLKTEPIGWPETSVTNYQSTLHNTKEEQRSHDCVVYWMAQILRPMVTWTPAIPEDCEEWGNPAMYKYAMKEEIVLKLHAGNRPHIKNFDVTILEQKIWIQEGTVSFWNSHLFVVTNIISASYHALTIDRSCCFSLSLLTAGRSNSNAVSSPVKGVKNQDKSRST